MGYNQSQSEAAKASRAFYGLAEQLADQSIERGVNSPRENAGFRKARTIIETASKLHGMKQHPNYQHQVPLPGETLVQFSLRWAAHLISPPQEPEESYDLECVDIAAAIQLLAPEIEAAWAAAHPQFIYA